VLKSREITLKSDIGFVSVYLESEFLFKVPLLFDTSCGCVKDYASEFKF
jgi:hypothetical protein